MEKENISFLSKKYFELDKPVPYKEFMISPVLVEDYYEFYGSIECLLLKKNRDPNGIPMSYLEYLLYKNETETDKIYFYRFAELLRLCLNIQNGLICPICGRKVLQSEILAKHETGEIVYEQNIFLCGNDGAIMSEIVRYEKTNLNKFKLKIGDREITKDEFNEIKNIICYQNMLDYSDEYINPDFEDDLKEAERLRSKEIEFPSLEKQMCCVVSGSTYKFEELYKMSIRKFLMLLKTIDRKLHYSIYKMNENSGAVTFNGGLDHWIYEKKKSMLDNVVSYDKFKQKMQHVAAI